MEDTQGAGICKEKDGGVSSSHDEQSTQVNLKEMLKDKRENRRLSIKGQDLYTIMDLPKDSSEDEINSKYRNLARRVHQDKDPNNKEQRKGEKKRRKAKKQLGFCHKLGFCCLGCLSCCCC